MKTTVTGIVAGMALVSAFANVAIAQDQRCAPESVLQYDLNRDGLTLQSYGDISGEDGHRIELYANSDTGRWTLMEIKPQEDACFYRIGAIFFHEGEQAGDGAQTNRQSAMAYHANGDGGNEAFEFFAHEATGRWFLSRRISATESEVVLAGDNYAEENNPPYQPRIRIRDFSPGE